MNNVELMTVEDRFVIRGRGVVLLPDFSVPTGWTDRSEPVTIVPPDGDSIIVPVTFVLTHYSFSDPTPNQNWRITILVPGYEREDIPVGSIVFATPETQNLLAQ